MQLPTKEMARKIMFGLYLTHIFAYFGIVILGAILGNVFAVCIGGCGTFFYSYLFTNDVDFKGKSL